MGKARAMSTDQYTLSDPTKLYADIDTRQQTHPSPGLDAKLDDKADLGETTYRGSGRLEGRRALITGGDSGIGAATAIAFAREGADVAISYLESEETDARRIIQLVNEAGRKGLPLPGDLTDPTYCRNLVAQAVEGLGGLDILVNNGAEQTHIDDLADLTDEQFDMTLKTNVYAMFWITKAALPHLKPGSTIINSTSIQAYNPSPGLLDYAATKAAINNFSKGLAQQLAPKGIRVNAVAPGPIWTPLIPATMPVERAESHGESTPMGRAGQPAEVAPAYVFFASQESSYITAEMLAVTGGQPVT